MILEVMTLKQVQPLEPYLLEDCSAAGVGVVHTCRSEAYCNSYWSHRISTPYAKTIFNH